MADLIKVAPDTRKIIFGQFDLSQLKAYYKFNELTGNLINKAASVGSVSSNGVDFTNTGVTQGVAGVLGTAYKYVGDSITKDGAASTDWQFLYGLDEIFTFIGWYKQTAASEASNTVIMDNSDSLNGRGILFQVIGTQNNRLFRFGFFDGSLEILSMSAGDFPSDTNFHMLMVRCSYGAGADNVTLSVDDTNLRTFTTVRDGDDGVANDQMGIGAIPRTPPVSEALGSLDEFSLWNRLLTDKEVTKMFNAGISRNL